MKVDLTEPQAKALVVAAQNLLEGVDPTMASVLGRAIEAMQGARHKVRRRCGLCSKNVYEYNFPRHVRQVHRRREQ